MCKLLAIVILFVVFLAGCTTNSKMRSAGSVAAARSNTSAPAALPVPVQVFEVQPSTSNSDLLIPGTITVEGTATVLSQRDGIVTQVNVREGERIAKGQTIATLSSDDQLTQLHQAELEVSRLKIEEQQYESLVNISRNDMEREQALFKDGVSSQRDLERARFKLEGASSELDKTRIATRTAQARVEAVKFEVRKGTIIAPIGGVVTRCQINLGTSITKNDKLFDISPQTSLQVRFQLPQSERGRLGAGSLITLTLPDSDRTVARARVRRLDPLADVTSNTFGYLADVIDHINMIPGTSVNIRYQRGANSSGYWIPRAAFPAGAELRDGATATLMIVENNRCAARTVRLNSLTSDQVEIANGLAAGERVIIAPPASLKIGDLLEPS